jgi:hypothetical protein
MKTKHMLPFNWQDRLVNQEKDSIDNEFVLLDRPVIASPFPYPWKIDAIALLCRYHALSDFGKRTWRQRF